MWVYNGHFGILSGIGIRLGILDGPFSFLAYKNSAFIATMVTDIWVGVPFVTLFFLAGMQAIPRDLYEAAYCDGAGRFNRWYHITGQGQTPTTSPRRLNRTRSDSHPLPPVDSSTEDEHSSSATSGWWLGKVPGAGVG